MKWNPVMGIKFGMSDFWAENTNIHELGSWN